MRVLERKRAPTRAVVRLLEQLKAGRRLPGGAGGLDRRTRRGVAAVIRSRAICVGPGGGRRRPGGAVPAQPLARGRRRAHLRREHAERRRAAHRHASLLRGGAALGRRPGCRPARAVKDAEIDGQEVSRLAAGGHARARGATADGADRAVRGRARAATRKDRRAVLPMDDVDIPRAELISACVVRLRSPRPPQAAQEQRPRARLRKLCRMGRVLTSSCSAPLAATRSSLQGDAEALGDTAARCEADLRVDGGRVVVGQERSTSLVELDLDLYGRSDLGREGCRAVGLEL